jgi:hypothetical protein
MSRPEKHEHEKRSERFQFRLTIAEKEHVIEQATKLGIKPADYARNRVIGHRVEAPVRPKFDPALVSEVNRIGVNINQLARAVHTDRDFVKYWREIGGELESILEKLVEANDP